MKISKPYAAQAIDHWATGVFLSKKQFNNLYFIQQKDTRA